MPHSIDIYRGNDLFVSIKPDDSCSQSKTIMGDNIIQLDFVLNHYAKFMVNDYCTVFGETYIIAENPPAVTKVNRFEWRYTLKMKSWTSELEKIEYFFLGPDNTLREPVFSLMGNAQTFIELLLMNTERFITDQINFGPSYLNHTLWTASEVVITDYKNLSFSSDNCLSALSKIADAFGTEWWAIGKNIILAKRINDTAIKLQHGRGKGLYEIQRAAADNSKIVTRIYPFGNTTNIPPDYGSERLRLSNIPTGSLFHNHEFYGMIEQTVIFEDIYPKRTGKVTSTDATNVYKFVDNTMDFDLNAYLLPGLSPKVVFNTGQLAGYQFEVSHYDPATKQITILKNKDETALDIPSVSLHPAVGDEYVFVDIKLPGGYIDAAEFKLYQAAAAWLLENAEPKYTLSITLDPKFVSNRGYSFSIGDLITITDGDLEIDKKIRVVSTQRKIVEENEYSLTLSDVIPKGFVSTVNNSISSTQQNVSNINYQIQNNAFLNGRMVIPSVTDVTGMSPLYIDNATDKIYKKV